MIRHLVAVEFALHRRHVDDVTVGPIGIGGGGLHQRLQTRVQHEWRDGVHEHAFHDLWR